MDLKSPWPDPPLADHALGGDSVVSSGSDPVADGGKDGPAGLKDFWEPGAYPWPPEVPVQVVEAPSGAESPNSVSGLPRQPNRFEPAADRVEPPSLEDRTPGTIDKR